MLESSFSEKHESIKYLLKDITLSPEETGSKKRDGSGEFIISHLLCIRYSTANAIYNPHNYGEM